jgi:hypothetical protein
MPALPLIEELITEYRTLDDVLRSLASLEQIFYEQRDRRAVFVTTYRIAAAGETNPALTIAAANLYRAALLAYENDDRTSLPKSWKLAFDAARHNDALLMQDLFLGINAHVNHDLPFALDARRDSIGEALVAAIEQVESRIETIYAPALRLLGRAIHPLVSDITSFDLTKALDLARHNAQALADARSDEERAAIARRIDDHSAAMARLILAPTARKLVLDSLRKIESASPWWRFLVPKATAHAVQQPLAVNTLDELIARLKEIAQQYDSRRSRMSVDPTAHAEFCQKIKNALANGAFADPDWITRLNLCVGTLYIHAVSSFDQGKLDSIPDCWLMAFQMAANGDNLLLQDVLAALNARYNYDLPLALSQSGASNQPDLEKFQTMFRDHIIEFEQSIVNRYTDVPMLPNLLTGPLQGILAEFPFDRSLMLSAPDASAITQRILLKGLPGASWVIHALHHIENEYRGPWSEWHTAATGNW